MNVSKDSLSDDENPKYKSVACQTDITGRKPRASLATVLRLDKLKRMRQAEKDKARWNDFLELEEYRMKQKEIEEFQRVFQEYPEETAFLNVPDDRLDELPVDEQERLISRLMRVYRRYFD
ncbi:hypothetical protein B9Z55_006359 [Caenorhabditis nigoni]|uniref:Uncharacterized protein n=1 Tax=Caenorhabditis nigoni TaxID=1611254 RepID=A0A2G5V4Q4_9PELO|nr:hypothetical protein B9Z55_006359 [Caenorhabditis nigoni]